LVAFLFTADKLLGLVRDAAVARAFGASAALDAYYAAFELPDGLFTIVAGSAMATALIPILTAHIAPDDRRKRLGTALGGSHHREVWQLVSAVINWVLMVVAGVSVAGAIFAPQIIRVVAPGFHGDQALLAARLMRLVLCQTLISSVSGIVMSVLQAHQHFLLPAAAPICYTLGRIGGALWLAPRWGIFGLAWGGLAGTVGHFLIQVPGLIYYRARWWPRLRHPELQSVLALMGPRVLGLGATYLNFVLPTFLGSHLPAGAISAYEYSWRLMQFPETIIGTALGLAVFPTLAEQANAGNREGLRRTVSWALRLVLALAVPAAVGLLALGHPLITLFFQRGAFDATIADRVYGALRFFALGLVAHSMLEVVSRLFYAQRDMWAPFWAALGGVLFNAGLGWSLLSSLGAGSIALSNSLGVGLQVGILLIVARRRMGGGEGVGQPCCTQPCCTQPCCTQPCCKQSGLHSLPFTAEGEEWLIGASLVRTVIASALMGAAVMGFRIVAGQVWAPALPGRYGTLLYCAGGLTVGTGVYVLSALLLGSEEIRQLPRLLLGRG
jgi:putative peptidoglycan lipid II flippase